jgi:3-deoxy-D-manno-octulosonic-acid transferase
VQWARDNNLSVATLSGLAMRAADTQSTPDQSTDVIVIDRTGVLGDLYAIANIAFVGGAFHKAGLHSVIEPAAFGVPVLFGPGYAMSREAGLLLDCGGALSVWTVSECTGAIETWLTDVKQRNDSGERAKLFVQSELGAAERSLQLVLHTLT